MPKKFHVQMLMVQITISHCSIFMDGSLITLNQLETHLYFSLDTVNIWCIFWYLALIVCYVVSVLGSTAQKEFLVKYKGLAYVHNRWVPENQLLLEAPSLLMNFNMKDQVFYFLIFAFCISW